MNAHQLRMDFLQIGMGNEVSHWQSMGERSMSTKVLKCPFPESLMTLDFGPELSFGNLLQSS